VIADMADPTTADATAANSTTAHASAVLVGARAVLIRGPSGAGKSRLALDLIEAAQAGALRFARLVADDRVRLHSIGGRLLVRPAEALAGLLEVHGAGVLRLAYEPIAVLGFVVDLAAEDAERPRSPVSHYRGLRSQPIRRPCRRFSPSSSHRVTLGFDWSGRLRLVRLEIG
jgi:HPr kinase/phosphorylase